MLIRPLKVNKINKNYHRLTFKTIYKKMLSAGAQGGEESIDLQQILDQIDRLVGQGSFGTVYFLSNTPDEVLKEVRTDGILSEDLKDFKDNLYIALRVNHPNVLRYSRVLEEGDFLYICAKRYQESLESMLKRHKRTQAEISEAKIIEIFTQIASAMVYFADSTKEDSAGRRLPVIIHRALKPTNVLISTTGTQFVLSDFGFCRENLHTMHSIDESVYSAPEVLLEKRYSTASDIWSAGVILYELATLCRPSFFIDKKPKDVFVEGWKPDLSMVTINWIRNILEKIFVLRPESRPTAVQLLETIKSKDSDDSSGTEYWRRQYELIKKERDLCLARIANLEELCNDQSQIIINQDLQIRTLINERSKTSNKKCDNKSTDKAPRAHSKAPVASTQPFTKSKNLTNPANHPECSKISKSVNITIKKSNQSNLVFTSSIIQAVHNNDIETVRSIIEARAGTKEKDKDGMTALMHAAQKGYVEMVELLVIHEKGEHDNQHRTALMLAASAGHTPIVKILAKYEARMQMHGGVTALMIAAQCGRIDAAKVLFNYEKRMQDNDSQTALIYATKARHIDIIKLLVEEERGIIAKGSKLALTYAMENGIVDAINVLFDYESKSTGCTQLMYAAAIGDIVLAKSRLNESGQKNGSGWTALMYAATSKNVEIALLLHSYERGMVNKRGDTAYTIATANGCQAIAALLELYEKHLSTNKRK